MLNTEYILEAIRPYLTKDKKLRESDFDRLFSTLTRKEQYEIIKILIDNDIDYVDVSLYFRGWLKSRRERIP